MTMIHSIRLTTRDGHEVRFDCGEDEAVTTAAARAGMTLPTLCGSGGCGTCRATCTDGIYDLAPHSSTALPADAAAAGAVLLCRTRPRGALTLAAPFDHAHILTHTVPERGATVTALDPVAAGTVRLAIQLDPHEDLGSGADFEPGQCMELEIPGTGIRRAYSIASAPNWDGTMEFLIRRQPGGRFSSWLATEAKVGARLAAYGPCGHFTLQERGLAPRWFVAGGTGVAPFLSMLRRMADWGDAQQTRLFFGVNREEELFADDTLSALAVALPALSVVRCVRQPGNGWAGTVGTPVDVLDTALTATAVLPDLYVCGPPAMIEAVKATATRHGLSDGQVFCEAFLPSGAATVPA